MRYDKYFGVIVFAILIMLAIATSLYITPLSISDSDPSTYVIVPILMLPLFALFMAKERIRPEVRAKDILLGISAFVLLVAFTIYLRFEFSYLFLSYRLDMLLFPLLILSFAFLLFGSGNIGRFKAIAIYSILASPLLLTPFIAANQGFAVFNTMAVYSVARLFIHNLAYIAPITIAANGHQLGIGQTCVGVGVLIGIVFFLLPIAYLYKGGVGRKALWVFSGVLLLFLLNYMRMLGITLGWIIYGPSEAILGIHLFAGILLFYLSIIVIILIAGRYGLVIGSGRRERRARSSRSTYGAVGVVVAVLIGFAYFAFTYNYSTASYTSPIYLNRDLSPQFTNQTVAQMIPSLINGSGYNASLWLQTGNSVAVFIWGKGISQSSPLIAYVAYPNASVESGLLSRNTLLGSLNFIDGRGFSGRVYDLESNGTGFVVYDTRLPYVLPGEQASSELSVYLVLPSGEVTGSCGGGYGIAYTYALNAFNPSMYNKTVGAKLLSAYCELDRLIA